MTNEEIAGFVAGWAGHTKLMLEVLESVTEEGDLAVMRAALDDLKAKLDAAMRRS